MRAYLLALGLPSLLIGLFLWFAGSVHIGCTAGGSSSAPTFANCGGPSDLIFGGIDLTAVAGLLLVGSFVPDSTSRCA